jgi:allantoinase
MKPLQGGALNWPVSDWPDRNSPPITWPGKARVAFWVAPNIEFYEIAPPPNATRPAWPRPYPDILNVTARDYGNRVGVWRCLEVFDRHGVVGSVSLNSAMCRHFPAIVGEFAERGWELFCHGQYNTRYLFGMSREEQREAIGSARDEIEAFWGKKVGGFLAPALTYTEETLGLLVELGFSYTLDLFDRDAPYRLRGDLDSLVSVPYQVELNDFHALTAQGQAGEIYLQRFKDQFDRLYAEGGQSGKVVGLPLHPYIIGQPQYIWVLDAMLAHVRSHSDVWITTGGEIADHFRTNHARRGETR